MNPAASSLLIQFFDNLDIFLLIFIRMTGFFIIFPVFAGTNIPVISKIGFSLAASYIIFAAGVVEKVFYYNTVPGFVILIVKEFFVGFTMGYVVYLIFSIIYFSGQLLDYQIGFSMVSVFDPVSQIQVPITGNIYYFFVMALFIETGGLNSFLSALFYSYKVVPPGNAVLIGNAILADIALKSIVSFFIIGVKIALPVVGSILVLDSALGILTKAVPQMNVFVVGVPIKILVGLTLIYILAPILITMYNLTYENSYNAIINIIMGMKPQ